MKNLLCTAAMVMFFFDCFSQDSIIVKTFNKDSVEIHVVITYRDMDSRINELNKESDSLLRVDQIRNNQVTSEILACSEKIRNYILDLIKEGGFDEKANMTLDSIYNYEFKNSSLAIELEKYRESINSLYLNSTVKKIALLKSEKVNNNAVRSCTHKYNTPLTILKMQLYKVISGENYLLDSEDVAI